MREAMRRKTNFENFHSYVGGLANMTVVIIKGVLYATALTGLVFASRAAIARQGAVGPGVSFDVPYQPDEPDV